MSFGQVTKTKLKCREFLPMELKNTTYNMAEWGIFRRRFKKRQYTALDYGNKKSNAFILNAKNMKWNEMLDKAVFL
jgi:hypothetical protein